MPKHDSIISKNPPRETNFYFAHPHLKLKWEGEPAAKPDKKTGASIFLPPKMGLAIYLFIYLFKFI